MKTGHCTVCTALQWEEQCVALRCVASAGIPITLKRARFDFETGRVLSKGQARGLTFTNGRG